MSGSDIHDFVQLGAEGQVTPTNVTTPGVIQSGSLQTVLSSANFNVGFELSTQDNNFPPFNVQPSNYPWATTVASNYFSPGKIGGP